MSQWIFAFRAQDKREREEGGRHTGDGEGFTKKVRPQSPHNGVTRPHTRSVYTVTVTGAQQRFACLAWASLYPYFPGIAWDACQVSSK